MERINKEAQASRFFLPAKHKNYSVVLKKYLHPEEYFKDGCFEERTGGDGNTEAFREYLRTYIRDFRPDYFLPDKSLKLNLKRNGEFYTTEEKGRDPAMTDEEDTIFQYLCYLYVFDFWKGFEEMRDIHYVSKPLIIQDFSKRIMSKGYFKKLINMARSPDNKVVIKREHKNS